MTVQELIDLLSQQDRRALVNLHADRPGMVGIAEVYKYDDGSRLNAVVVRSLDSARPPGRPSKVSPAALEGIKVGIRAGASHRQIAHTLNALALPSATGGAWHPSSVGYWARKLAAQS